MPSHATSFIACLAALVLAACPAGDGAPKAAPTKLEPAKAEPPPALPPKVEDARAETKVAAPAPPVITGEALSFQLGDRTFPAAVALASQFNGQRRINISSQPLTCAELLAIPEIAKKGRVSFIINVPWKSGKHPLTGAEILDDDTRKITPVAAPDGTIEIEAGPDRAGEKGKIKLAVRGAEGGASGVIDVELCE